MRHKKRKGRSQSKRERERDREMSEVYYYSVGGPWDKNGRSERWAGTNQTGLTAGGVGRPAARTGHPVCWTGPNEPLAF